METGTRILIDATAYEPILNARVPYQTGKNTDSDKNNEQHDIEPQQMRVLVEDPVTGARDPLTIPVLTGNSVVGSLLRLLLHDLLARLDLTRPLIAEHAGHSENVRLLYHTLQNGGTLGAGDLVPPWTLETEEAIRQEWPVWSVLGCSIGSRMITSRISLHALRPASRQLAALFPDDPAFHQRLQTFDPATCLVSARDPAGTSGARHADGLVPYPDIKKGGKLLYRSMVQPHRGYIAAGTPLLGWIEVLSPLTPVEAGLLSHGLQLLQAHGRFGGWGHSGFGGAAIRIVGHGDPAPYLTWVTDHRPVLQDYLTGHTCPTWMKAVAAKQGTGIDAEED